MDGQAVGDPTCLIHGVATLDDAREGDITFLSHPRHRNKARSTQASALIVRDYLEGVPCPLLLAPDPHYAFARLLAVFYPARPTPVGIDPRAVVHPSAVVGDGATIGPCVVVEEGARIGARARVGAGTFIGAQSQVGDDALIYPNVTLREGVKIGHRVIVHSGAVVGSDGFGFVPHQGQHFKVPQVGGVTVEDDVEIGAGVTIDRATLGQTVIGRGTKINNLVQIGHNVKIGADCIVIAQVGISGSVCIGNRVTLAGQVGVAGHLSIGDQTVVAARAVVTKDIPPKSNVAGFPACAHPTWLKMTASLARLPDLRKKVQDMEAQLAQVLQRMALLEGRGP